MTVALIASFTPVRHEKHTVHEPVECGYKIFTDGDGIRYVQFDTYGTAGRTLPGKVSQSIQLDRGATTVVIRVLRQAFPGVI